MYVCMYISYVNIYVCIHAHICIYIYKGRSKNSKLHPEGIGDIEMSWKYQRFSVCPLASVFLENSWLIPKILFKNFQLWQFFLGRG